MMGLLLALRVNLVLILMFIAGYVHMIWGAGQLAYFVQDIWSVMDREMVLAVPLFILVGSVMSRGSIAKRLVDVIIALTRPVPGGLAVATILSCRFLGDFSVPHRDHAGRRGGALSRAAVPFVVLMLLCLLLITFRPWIALALVPVQSAKPFVVRFFNCPLRARSARFCETSERRI